MAIVYLQTPLEHYKTLRKPSQVTAPPSSSLRKQNICSLEILCLPHWPPDLSFHSKRHGQLPAISETLRSALSSKGKHQLLPVEQSHSVLSYTHHLWNFLSAQQTYPPTLIPA